MKTGIFKIRINFIRVFMSLIVTSLLFCSGIMKVYASSWVDKNSDTYEMLYGTEDTTNSDETLEMDEDEPGMVEDFFSGLIISLSKQLNNLLISHDINLSIDGIVFGRMAASIAGSGYVKADFTHFGLEENNPWGIIGATAFYALRNICLVVLPIILLALLILELFQNSAKGRVRLKELAMHTVYVFGLLFILPYALDLFIYFRDVVLFAMYQTMNYLATGISGGTSSGGLGIVDMMLEAQDGRLLNALVLLASVCAGLFFLVDYIRIALLLTLSFGLFPLIAVMSFWNHKKLSEWSNVFFPNLLVPFIDMLLVLIPTVLNALFVRLFGNGLNSILIGLIILIVIWNVIVVRNRIVKLLGFDGMGGAGGFGQMLETLAHLRPHHKKEVQEKEKSGGEKDNSRAGASDTENRSASGSYQTDRDRMSPAVREVINSDSTGEYRTQSTLAHDTDEFLADMNDSAGHPGVNENDSGSESVRVSMAEADGNSETQKADKQADQLVSSDAEQPRVVSQEPVEDKNDGHTDTEGVNQYSKSINMPNRLRDIEYSSARSKKVRETDSENVKSSVKKGVKTSAKIAVGGAMGVAGAFAAGYGGMGTSVGAGIVAAHGGASVVDGAASALEHAPETIEKGKLRVKEAVMSAYQRDYEIFDREMEEFTFQNARKEADKRAAQGAKEAARKRESLEREAKEAYQKADDMAYKDFID